jgi:dihydrodipicolinate reductase
MKDVLLYGVGKLGESILKGLIDRDISVYHESYNGPNDKENVLDYNGVIVDILNSSKLKNNIYNKELKEVVSYIVVTLVGSVLEKEIDFLLSLDIPLIILSTKYDEKGIKQKALNANVKILMSQNMAFGIVDFWDRIKNMDILDPTLKIDATVVESHQSMKADISGSAMTALKLFENKGFNVTFPENDSFKVGEDGKSGSFTWLRNEESQIEAGIPEEFLSGHGYHIFELKFEIYDFNFIRSLFKYFSSLENYSIEGVFEFNVYYEDKSLYIIHNINGRDIYTDGVVKSINFLEDVDLGVYSAIDIIS